MIKSCILFLLLAFTLLQAKEQTLTISTGFNVLEAKLLKNILKEVSKRAGFKLDFQILPNKRSLINANSGINDGEAARIEKISNMYPNLLKVDVSMHSIDIVVITKKKLLIKKISDLKKYQIGIIRGLKITEEIAAGLDTNKVIKATDYKSLVRMLTLGRIDAIIVNKLGAYTDLKEFKNETFYLWSKPIISPKLYTHLNKKNKSLIPKFEKAYRSMIKDGTLERMHQEFDKEVVKELLHSVRVIPYD